MSSSIDYKPVWLPSPNYSTRRNNLKPRFIVIHYTAMATCELAIERLCSPMHEVSCHYLISEKGKIFQLVKEEMRAWHAGAGEWKGLEDINSRSIGIELANQGNHPFPLPQIYSLEEILSQLMCRWKIPNHNIIGHSDMAIGRKVDPGGKFDWRGLSIKGLSIWPDSEYSEPVDKDEFVSLATTFGYSLPKSTQKGTLNILLENFRTRFRPWASGGLNEQDMGCLRNLVNSSTG